MGVADMALVGTVAADMEEAVDTVGVVVDTVEVFVDTLVVDMVVAVGTVDLMVLH